MRINRFMLTCVFGCALFPLLLSAADTPVSIGVEAEDFQYKGDWVTVEEAGCSGRAYLFAGAKGAALPAVTAVQISRAGTYHLWVKARDYATYHPGMRTLTVSVNGIRSQEVFGNSLQEGWSWEPGGAFDLPSGRILLGIHDVAKVYGRVDAILLTTDAGLTPQGMLGTRVLKRVRPEELVLAEDADLLGATPITSEGSKAVATLENEYLRYEFFTALGGGRQTIIPHVEMRQGDQWQRVEVNPADEIYAVVKSDVTEIGYIGMFPRWVRSKSAAVEVKAGDVRLTTSRSNNPPEIWRAGEFFRFTPVTAEHKGNAVVIRFAPLSVGVLVAEWRLLPGRRAANVTLSFTPAADGSYSLGYHMFFRKPLAEVEELQLPLAFQRKRFPDQAYVVLDPRAPTPISLAQTGKGAKAISWALSGDPAEIPFAWPDWREPHMGLCIRDDAGNVQPAIYGPVPGTAKAKTAAQTSLSFQFNVIVQPGEWYAAYRTVADEVFGLRDYRRNQGVSLSDAVLNMIDLIKDDEFGGWWDEPKGWYQIESRNTITHSTPATMLSLYRLTGDRDLYQRRVLPTLQYVLSRDSVHFTPTPDDSGRYRSGAMGGPVKQFGTSTYTALDRLAGGYTPAFRRIALPADGKICRTVGYSHADAFNEWAARYRITGNPDDLREAVRLADDYLATKVIIPPTTPVGYTPFWLISYVPDWEGLLMMYELTGEKRYLDGAVMGARQLMVGLWTQPLFPEGNTTLFAEGKYDGDPWNGHLLARGPDMVRLGFPLQADSLKEHQAPAWSVSCVGLGFEQPSTLGRKGNRLIYQAVWAPEFLRLARYTGDKAFESCARNAVVGRWGNYPGYYVAGHMDLVLDPRYPYVGPDQSVIYYHHIVPHLSWCIDYLVSDVELLSDGRIRFPWLRENGYAFFDGRVYGHAPGDIFDEKGCWLCFNRAAVSISNPQINSLTAHNDTKFFAILTNQAREPQSAEITFAAEMLGVDLKNIKSLTVRGVDGERSVDLNRGVVKLDFKSRELLVVEVPGSRVDIAAHRLPIDRARGDVPSELVATAGDITLKAAAIAVDIGSWDAFIWCAADPTQVKSVTLEVNVNGVWKSQSDTKYPFEFNVSMQAPEDSLQFRVFGESPSGEKFSSGSLVVGAP